MQTDLKYETEINNPYFTTHTNPQRWHKYLCWPFI